MYAANLSILPIPLIVASLSSVGNCTGALTETATNSGLAYGDMVTDQHFQMFLRRTGRGKVVR